jgi:hypothetical protein
MVLLKGNANVGRFARLEIKFYSCVMFPGPNDLWAGNIHNAVDGWFSQASAEATYGPITAWNTAAVTSLENLFCSQSAYWCGTADDLGATPWDVG